MEAAVMILPVVYVAVAVGTWPMFVRYRYREIKRHHPHTHERDVRRDALLALTQAALCAVLWLPVVVARATLTAGWRLARWVLGRTLRQDYSAARVERFSAELASYDARENVIDLRPQARPRPQPLDRDAMTVIRAKIAEASLIKRELERLDADSDVARELRATLLRVAADVDALADRLLVAR